MAEISEVQAVTATNCGLRKASVLVNMSDTQKCGLWMGVTPRAACEQTPIRKIENLKVSL